METFHLYSTIVPSMNTRNRLTLLTSTNQYVKITRVTLYSCRHIETTYTGYSLYVVYTCVIYI